MLIMLDLLVQLMASNSLWTSLAQLMAVSLWTRAPLVKRTLSILRASASMMMVAVCCSLHLHTTYTWDHQHQLRHMLQAPLTRLLVNVAMMVSSLPVLRKIRIRVMIVSMLSGGRL